MLLSVSSRSRSLDGLHLVVSQESEEESLSSTAELSLSAESVQASVCSNDSISADVAPAVHQLHQHHGASTRRPNEFARVAWEVSNKFSRRSHAARQVALRTAAILHMRKNSAALKVASMQDRPRHTPSSSPGVGRLQYQLSALDLELQRSTNTANRQLTEIQSSHHQHLQLLRELKELEGQDDAVGVEGADGAELLVSSLPCLDSMSGSPKPRKPDKIAGLKRVAKSTTWGRVLGSKLSSQSLKHPPPEISAPVLLVPPALGCNPFSFEAVCLPPPTQLGTKRGSATWYGSSLLSALRHGDRAEPERNAGGDCGGGGDSGCGESGGCDVGGGDSEEDGIKEQVDSVGDESYRTEVSLEALAEIAAFKQLIDTYFATAARYATS